MLSSHTDRLVGVFLVALSAACFGTNAIFAHIGYDAGANPCTFLFIRFLIASLVMFLIMTARGLNFPKGRLLVSLALIGGIGLAGATLSFYTAIQLAARGKKPLRFLPKGKNHFFSIN